MNPLCCGTGRQMNFAIPKMAAIPLGPPRQSKTHHSTPTGSSSGAAGKSVGCQTVPSKSTPVKVENFSVGKPDVIATCLIEVQKSIQYGNLFISNYIATYKFIF